MLSDVEYASLLVYSPRGSSRIARASRDVCWDLKGDRNDMVRRVIGYLHDDRAIRQLFRPFLDRQIVLVPTPRSTLLVSGALWPARRIAEELVARGLGSRVLECLIRKRAVATSHRAQPGERPDARMHYESLGVRGGTERPPTLTLVDDVITRGDTLLAAASRLRDAYPDSEIKAFAIVRTMGLVTGIDRIPDPATGRITLTSDGRVERRP